jgi:hypothetical protein
MRIYAYINVYDSAASRPHTYAGTVPVHDVDQGHRQALVCARRRRARMPSLLVQTRSVMICSVLYSIICQRVHVDMHCRGV